MACLDTIAVTDFKDQFPRDFLYLPVWEAGTYNLGDVVLYDVDGLTYYCSQDGVTSTPDTLGADWRLATTEEKNDFVLDSDITKAFKEAELSFNTELVGSDDCTTVTFIFYYLTAHYLINDLKASTQSGATSNLVSSRTVGSVSESYEIPDAYKNDPTLNFYTSTYYGVKYLNFVYPRMKGNMTVVQGRSTPW